MYMEEKYSKFLEDSYKAIDKTNFYDAIYSPVILISNSITIAIVVILSSLENGKSSCFSECLPVSAAVIFLYYPGISPLESIGMEIQTIQSAAAGVPQDQ